jgi:tRNA A37 methylthiotransferase MiaB
VSASAPPKAPPSVGVVSLGCPKNLVDTEVMLGHLQQAGHAIVPDGEARVVLVNTCGFIDRAKEESVETILEQVERKRRGEIDRVVVAGCMVQKYGRLRRARRARARPGGGRGPAGAAALRRQATRDAALRRTGAARSVATAGLRVPQGR